MVHISTTLAAEIMALAGRRNGTRPTKDCPGPWSLRKSTHAEHTVSVRRADQELENEIRKDASLRTAETHESEDKNFARKLESSDKVNGDTALLVETENCQPEARPSGASPNLLCGSITASNVTHEPVEVINQRDSQGIPQTLTGESPQGTSQSLLGRLLYQQDELKETPWFFIKPHPKIDERTTQFGSKETEESTVTFPTNSRNSKKKKLEFVINDLAKVTLQKETTNHSTAQ
eukprot:Gb_26369 [translate_table: standard]